MNIKARRFVNFNRHRSYMYIIMCILNCVFNNEKGKGAERMGEIKGRKVFSDPVRWGILGCGDVTEVKSGPAFAKAEGSEIAASMRRDSAKAEDYAKRHNIPRWYDDADSLINDNRVDAVYIATPPESHKLYTLKAAAAGKPVYVEKPMAMNVKEVQEMISACEKSNVPLFVAFYRRRLPVFTEVKRIIEEGTIGTPRSLTLVLKRDERSHIPDGNNLPWRYIREISGGGIFVDMGSHQLDILDWILGPIKEARGFAVNRAGMYKVEDGVSAAFSFESGVIGTGLWDFTVADEAEDDYIEINGDLGRIRFSSFTHQNIYLETKSQKREWNAGKPDHVHQPLVQTIVDELHGRGKCPSTGYSALRTTRIMEDLLKDYYK